MIKKAAGIFFTDGKKVLLLRKKEGDDKGLWGLPGGTFEASKDSNVFDTAKREVKEETGVRSIPGKKLEAVFEKTPKVEWTTFIYKIDKPFNVHVSSEHDSHKWTNISDLSSTRLYPSFKENFHRYSKVIRSEFGQSFKEWLSLRESGSF